MRKMTVSKLRKLIDEVYKNNPRAVVAIDHDSFRASPDFSIHDVVSAELLHINLADGDGVARTGAGRPFVYGTPGRHHDRQCPHQGADHEGGC